MIYTFSWVSGDLVRLMEHTMWKLVEGARCVARAGPDSGLMRT